MTIRQAAKLANVKTETLRDCLLRLQEVSPHTLLKKNGRSKQAQYVVDVDAVRSHYDETHYQTWG